MKTIDEVSGFLKVNADRTAKAVFYESDRAGRPVLVLVRGDLEVNEAKLTRLIGTAPAAAQDQTVRATGAVPGFASGIGLKGCRIIVDPSVWESANLVCGANEPDFHCLNFNAPRDIPGAEVVEIAQAREGDGCPQCNGTLRYTRGIEVGNIFQLGTRYTDAMTMRYLDKDGKERTPVMGCYGIGIGRLAASIIEARHDTFGPIWPFGVAPFQVHCIALNLDPALKAIVDAIHRDLESAGIEVMYDDRNERPGVQFADADLIGAPLRLIFGAKNMQSSKVEWKRRGARDPGLIGLDGAVAFVKHFIEQESEKTGPRI